MMKKAFSLIEVLITLSIIGVAAALVIPKMHNIMPDRDKADVLQVVNEISSVTEDLLNDPAIYRDHVENGVFFSGLGDTSQPVDTVTYPAAQYTGGNKYLNLLRERLDKSGVAAAQGFSITIRTKNNIECALQSSVTSVAQNNFGHYANIQNAGNQNGVVSEQRLTTTLTLRRTGQASYCTHGDNDCTQPNQYTFSINNDGHIEGTDFLAQAFLINKNDLKNSGKDLKKADDLKKAQDQANQQQQGQ